MVREGHDAPDSRRDRERDRRVETDRGDRPTAREIAADARELAQGLRDVEQEARERRLDERDAERASAAHLGVLTARQRDVLAMIADGQSNQAIADRLYITLNTVKTTIRALYTKIDVATRTQAVRWYEHGPRRDRDR